MPTRKAAVKRAISTEPTEQEFTVRAAVPTSKIPETLRFPLLVTLNITVSALLYTLASPFTKGDLATVSGRRDQWWEITGLLGFKAAELAVGWWGGYDTTDLACLIFLTHVPYQFFLISFYKISAITAASCITIDIAAICIPFFLLRDVSAYHQLHTPKGRAANRSIIDDFGVQASTSLLAAGIYGVVVFGSFTTWLPAYLVTHFEGIRDISFLYSSTFFYLLLLFVPTGFAARIFLFTPTMAAKPDGADQQLADFNPEAATLAETVAYNLWGQSKRTRTMIERTTTLVAMGFVHTWLHTYGAVEGAEGFGAVGWSSIWALAAAVTGIALLVVGDVEGVKN